MPFAVELVIDSPLADCVRDVWVEMARHELGADMLAEGATPHVTLAVFDQIETVRAPEVLAAFASHTAAIELEFAHIGTFPGGIVFLGPIVVDELLEANRALHRAAAELSTSPWPYYLPRSWVPHCTLAEKLPPERVGDAVMLAHEILRFPLMSRLDSLQLVEFPPIRQLFAAPLLGV
jgi:2'-5' RNA ligase